MHLKEIRMENFKSFGARIAVPIQKGFTAITGPNGSGKSNIGDAILFVLGPRSGSAIRAKRLTDLIFNGAAGGKPAKECQVSLVFDNTDRLMPIDEDEVALTRRIRRAPKRGEPDHNYSYFYINDRAASLKEFTDLLAHARISSDGYNIVKQGDVTNIVEMSSVDRRKILEQIAGITEFDRDIEAADTRRGQVEGNLERIGIILNEIESTLGRLGKERDGALRYKELKERSDRLKGQLATRKRRDMEEEIAAVNANVAKYRDEKAGHEKALADAKARRKEAQLALAKVEDEMAKRGGKEVREVQGNLERLREEHTRIDEKVNYHRDEIQELGKDETELAKDLARIEKELERASRERQKLGEKAKSSEAEAERLEKELADLRDLVAARDDSALEIQRKLAKLKHDHEAKLTEKHELELAAEKLSERIDRLEKEVAEAQEKRSAAEFEVKDLTWQLKELKEEGGGRERTRLEKELLARKKRQAEVFQELGDLERALTTLRREVTRLQAEQETADGASGGYARAVEEVLKARTKGKLKGVCGTLVELGKVAKEHEVALQVAGSNRLQSIVVETDGDAAAAIEYLKEHKSGRATFLPLTKLAGGQPRGKSLMVVKDESSLGFAIDLVTYDKRYEAAFWFALGDTIVIKDLTSARRLMGGVRLVTPGGELLEASGAMVGGSLRPGGEGPKFSGADRGELERKQKGLLAAETHEEGLTAELATLRTDLTALEDEFHALGLEGQASEDRTKELERKRELQEKALERLAEDASGGGKRLEDARGELTETRESVATVEKELDRMEAERRNLGKALLAGTKKEVADQMRSLEERARKAKDLAVESSGEAEVQAKNVALIGERHAEMAEKAGKARAERGEREKALAALREDHGKRSVEIAALEKIESELTGELKELSAEREKVLAKVHKAEGDLSKFDDKVATFYSLVTREQGRLPAMEEELGALMVEIKEAHYAPAPDEELPPADELKRDLAGAERSIENLGPINQKALDEFDEQDKRKKDLLAEIERLKAQKEELVKLVAEITAKKKAGLMEVFTAINHNFAQVYKAISRGGEATLELENPEDPFEAGLTIRARPRGKKVLRLNALSGGEKSLTALAFIFAIQMYEPSPFYVLDEVDMFLDGVNSEIVGKMVSQRAKSAQFIMVSLRKVTLRESDHIYGVTMQRDGLSTLIANFDISQLSEEEEQKGVLAAQTLMARTKVAGAPASPASPVADQAAAPEGLEPDGDESTGEAPAPLTATAEALAELAVIERKGGARPAPRMRRRKARLAEAGEDADDEEGDAERLPDSPAEPPAPSVAEVKSP